ncbi:hypothetical protein SDC9_28371 [bioreactor metagenome]|uniref:Uncharacterized protein n=1 Tax=bioreactor metagenome TaxID=1076179 RepID=A0A644UTP4_9ZZZZ
MRYEGKEVERENQAEITNKIPGDCDMGFLRVPKVCVHDGSACVGWGMPRSAIPFLWLQAAAKPAFVLLCLLLCPGLSAFAAPRTVGDWVVEVPAGWKTQEEGNQVLLSSPKEDCYVTMLEKDCFNGDLDLLAKASASITGGNDLRTLGEGKGVVFADKIARYWVGLANDKYMEVSVGHACRGVGPIVKSLKISPKAKNAAPLSKLLAVAQGPENTKWLVTGDRPDDARPVEPADPTGDRPDFAALADLAAPAPAPHEKTIPQGWSTTHTGQWTIYDKPDEKVWYAVGLYPFKKVENGQWGTDLIDLARKLKGINITTGEGTVDFYTREGGIGTVLTNDANTVVELYYPEDDANLAELREALH